MSTTRMYMRREDMSPVGMLRVFLQPDGDVIVTVYGDPDDIMAVKGKGSVEFCSPGSGGGKSPHTIRALRELAKAIERDNAETPYFGETL